MTQISAPELRDPAEIRLWGAIILLTVPIDEFGGLGEDFIADRHVRLSVGYGIVAVPGFEPGT